MNSKLYNDATPDTQVTLLKEVQRGFDDAAKFTMYQNDSEYRERLDRHRSKKAKKKLGIQNLPERLKQMAE
jgi:hypothetical protein